MPLTTSARKVGVGKWVFLTWDRDSPDDSFVRGIVTKENTSVYEGLVRTTFGPELANAWKMPMHLFKIDASVMSKDIPGIHELAKHPVDGNELPIFEIIIDLNDSRGWSREKIADWLETLDNQPVFKVGDL